MKPTVSLLLFFLLPFSLGAPSKEPDVLDLGIIYDHPPGEDDETVRFSSKLTWNNLPNNDVWRDKLEEDERKLSRVAKEAYWQMMNMHFQEDGDENIRQLLGWKRRPTVMTALAVENNIFLSSSMKGSSFVYHGKDSNNPVYRELIECQELLSAAWSVDGPLTNDEGKIIDRDWPKHSHSASCGEIMALYAYFADRSGDLTGEELKNRLVNAINSLSGAHIVTVKHKTKWASKNKDQLLPYDDIIRYDPCGTEVRRMARPSLFGCNQITVDRFYMHAILKGEDEFDDIDLGDFNTSVVPISCTNVAGS